VDCPLVLLDIVVNDGMLELGAKNKSQLVENRNRVVKHNFTQQEKTSMKRSDWWNTPVLANIYIVSRHVPWYY
jgi:hypothetical protein